MEKIFEINYKYYSFEETTYTTYQIKALNRKDAFIKCVAECNSSTYEATHNLIKNKFGAKWSVDWVIERLSPIGTSENGLYRLDAVKRVKI